MTMAELGTDQMADPDAIRDLLAAYALRLDAEDIDGCLEFFADEGEFVVYGKTLIGRERIGRMFTRAPSGLHLIGAIHLDVRGATATVRSQVLFVDASTHEMRPALYDDELINIKGQWRFRSRRCQFITTSGLSDTPQQVQTP
jgi:ketosteroid isomerase-like protein